MKLLVTILLLAANVASPKAGLAQTKNDDNAIRVNKCCEKDEILMGDRCQLVSKTKLAPWKPDFTDENGAKVNVTNYKLVFGSPDCGTRQYYPVYHHQNLSDRLQLLSTGVLRHYFDHSVLQDDDQYEIEESHEKNILYYDYPPGKYCFDNRIDDEFITKFARLCAPFQEKDWTTSEFFMRNIVNPITHAIGLTCLMITAIVYFIMPTLRDLVGNIVTTICLCLIVSQVGDLIRLLTIFNNHISLIITETVCYIFMLGAFFWLCSLGYYIWKTFRSRNVFLRITDGRKYCYYSFYCWSCTLILGVLAVFAHFTMDYPQVKSTNSLDQQEEIGSLGIIIFFVPVAFTVLIDVFFFATTIQTINRMHTYGRIHHKLRHSFRLFLFLCIIMTIVWLFFLMSFLKFDGLVNSYIIVNALQGPLILYVCVFNQRHVSYLLRKSCCYDNCCCACCRPKPECEWGDEMTAMNTGSY